MSVLGTGEIVAEITQPTVFLHSVIAPLPLAVGGAFHSPLMEITRVELAVAIEKALVSSSTCSVYQNVDGLPYTDPKENKDNLLKQLTSPVRWTQSMKNMVANEMTEFVECGSR